MANAPLPQRRAASPDQGELRPVHQQRSFASLRSIGALILREMATTNGRSAGGYLWAIAEPVGGIALLTIIFSMGFRSPPIGTNFAIFYATGFLPFSIFMAMSGRISRSIMNSKALLAYPAVTFMDALIARTIFNAITQILVCYILFSGILLLMETRTDPQFEGIALATLMAFAFGIGVGVINCFLFATFPSWENIWSILTRPLFLLSCIFFMFDDMPAVAQKYLWYNPLVHVVGQMRKSFYPSYIGDYVSPIYVFAVSLTLIAIGIALLIRYHRDLQNS